MFPIKFYVFSAVSLLLATIGHLVYDSLCARQTMNFHVAGLSSRVLSSPTKDPIFDTADNLFWFMQISDLHFSAFIDSNRLSDFSYFCTDIVSTIRPELLSISGDLTDARSKIYLRSAQSVYEWTMYNQIITESGVQDVTQILDIRGNHDTFGVVSPYHDSDLFSSLGVRGQHYSRSYLHIVKKPFGKYSFINLDASQASGLKFPLNFFGQITNHDSEKLQALSAEAAGSNQTFWFAHYPTSTIVSPSLDLRHLLGETAIAYFCGHLHTLLHMAPRMHTLQPHGYLELELGDWKNDRYFRVVALDHDLVSFVDVQMPRDRSSVWPIVIVTNPKHSGYLLPHKEPFSRILQSKFIRILAWSASPITQVAVFIDDWFQGNASMATPATGSVGASPLFVLPWDASHWDDRKVHNIRVQVADAKGNRRDVSQPFIVTGDPTWKFDKFSSFVLQTDHTFNVRLFFYLVDFGFCAILILSRFIPCGTTRKYRCLRGLNRFSHCNPLYLPWLCYFLYLCIGPIFMGFLVDFHFGVVFSYGIYIAGSFLLESLTYFYEITQLLLIGLVYAPYLIWYCGGMPVDVRTRHQDAVQQQSNCNNNETDSAPTSPVRIPQPGKPNCGQIPFPLFCHAFIFSILQLLFILLTVAIPYGFVAILLCPGRLLPIYLSWYIAKRLPYYLENTIH